MERDLEYSDSRGQTGNFNSHAHVERDLNGNYVYGRTWDFNSHAHVERDIKKVATLQLGKISTHTLTWSVTQTKTENLDLKKFQLTRSRGA